MVLSEVPEGVTDVTSKIWVNIKQNLFLCHTYLCKAMIFYTILSVFALFFFFLQWFNLNSLLTGPELISDTYLALFLAQLQQEGQHALHFQC